MLAVEFLFHFVQLTEGRYARDIPKQLPSKKKRVVPHAFLLDAWIVFLVNVICMTNIPGQYHASGERVPVAFSQLQ